MSLIRRAWRRFRSSITGRFVSRQTAEAQPHTTYGERQAPVECPQTDEMP